MKTVTATTVRHMTNIITHTAGLYGSEGKGVCGHNSSKPRLGCPQTCDPVLLCPLLRERLTPKSSNISRNVSGPVVGSIGSTQPCIWPYSSLYLLPKSTVVPKVHSLKVIVGIQSTTPVAAGVNTLFLLRSHSPWCSTLVLDRALLVGCPLLSAAHPGKRG